MFVRTDIPIEQILVQASHAALESGIHLEQNNKEPSSLIVIQVKNKQRLQKSLQDIRQKGIHCIEFFEPSWEYGLTSFATRCVVEEERFLFKKYQLFKWKGSNNV